MPPAPSEAAPPAAPSVRVLRPSYCSTVSPWVDCPDFFLVVVIAVIVIAPSSLINLALVSISPLIHQAVILCASIAERLAYVCTSKAGRLACYLPLLLLPPQLLHYNRLASSYELLLINNFLRSAVVDRVQLRSCLSSSFPELKS